MKVIYTNMIIAVAVVGIVGTLFMFYHTHTLKDERTRFENLLLTSCTQEINQNLVRFSEDISLKLNTISSALSENRDFLMKLLVDNDFASSEIVDIGISYMKLSGLSYLDICDSNFTILSSGHMPASAGTSVNQFSELPERQMVCISKRKESSSELLLIMKISFSIREKRLYCIGGITLDKFTIKALSSDSNSHIFIKIDTMVYGDDSIYAQIDSTKSRNSINGDLYAIQYIGLPWKGLGTDKFQPRIGCAYKLSSLKR